MAGRLWRKQPQRLVGIDRTNPLAAGLKALASPFGDAVTGAVPSPITAATATGAGAYGMAWQFAASTAVEFPGVAYVPPPFTLVVIAHKANATAEVMAAFGGASTGLGWMLTDPGVAVDAAIVFGGVAQYNGPSGFYDLSAPRVYAITVSASSARFFRDGVFMGSAAVGTASVPAKPFTIGAYFIPGSGYGGFTSSKIYLAAVFSGVKSDADVAALSANPWQLYAPLQCRAQRASGAVITWIGPDGSGTGWVSTAATRWEAIDEAGAADDADYITSPYLTSTAVPAVETLTTPLTAGSYTFSVRARLTDALGSATLRVRFLSALNADVGVSGDQALTSTFATYSMTVTLSGTATQMQLEVVSP